MAPLAPHPRGAVVSYSNCYTCGHAEGDAAAPGCRLLWIDGWGEDVMAWWRDAAVPANATTVGGQEALELPRDADGCPHWQAAPEAPDRG